MSTCVRDRHVVESDTAACKGNDISKSDELASNVVRGSEGPSTKRALLTDDRCDRADSRCRKIKSDTLQDQIVAKTDSIPGSDSSGSSKSGDSSDSDSDSSNSSSDSSSSSSSGSSSSSSSSNHSSCSGRTSSSSSAAESLKNRRSKALGKSAETNNGPVIASASVTSHLTSAMLMTKAVLDIRSSEGTRRESSYEISACYTSSVCSADDAVSSRSKSNAIGSSSACSNILDPSGKDYRIPDGGSLGSILANPSSKMSQSALIRKSPVSLPPQSSVEPVECRNPKRTRSEDVNALASLRDSYADDVGNADRSISKQIRVKKHQKSPQKTGRSDQSSESFHSVDGKTLSHPDEHRSSAQKLAVTSSQTCSKDSVKTKANNHRVTDCGSVDDKAKSSRSSQSKGSDIKSQSHTRSLPDIESERHQPSRSKHHKDESLKNSRKRDYHSSNDVSSRHERRSSDNETTRSSSIKRSRSPRNRNSSEKLVGRSHKNCHDETFSPTDRKRKDDSAQKRTTTTTTTTTPPTKRHQSSDSSSNRERASHRDDYRRSHRSVVSRPEFATSSPCVGRLSSPASTPYRVTDSKDETILRQLPIHLRQLPHPLPLYRPPRLSSSVARHPLVLPSRIDGPLLLPHTRPPYCQLPPSPGVVLRSLQPKHIDQQHVQNARPNPDERNKVYELDVCEDPEFCTDVEAANLSFFRNSEELYRALEQCRWPLFLDSMTE